MQDDMAYSRLERILHSMAFDQPIFQGFLEDVEQALFRKEWMGVDVERPVFIASLPRSGTTITLEALFRIPGVATHIYRDMPFVLTPYLWGRWSGPLRKQSRMRERAHGDGLMIDENSPEAFEEIIWRKFFADHYREDGIKCWSPNPESGFVDYFSEHIKKIVALRARGSGRYVSKNNANIARIQFIKRCFSDALIITPVRDPFEHAISMWLQHLNFLERHERDPFSRKYMADIGHYEFGELHRPIQFPRFDKVASGLSPGSLDYWLAYWVSAYDHVLKQGGTNFFMYEDFCLGKHQSIATLARLLGLVCSEDDISGAASVLKAPPVKRQTHYQFDGDLAREAADLYQELGNAAVNLSLG